MKNLFWDKIGIIGFTIFLLVANEYKWFETSGLILFGIAVYGTIICLEVLSISERVQAILDKFKG